MENLERIGMIIGKSIVYIIVFYLGYKLYNRIFNKKDTEAI